MSSGSLQPLQGMSDISPPDIFRWQQLESAARRILHGYGFGEIRTPILERTDLFVRSLGDTTDVVTKEMYAFEDRGGRPVTMRPEGTAGVIRYIASKGPEAARSRLYYLGPMFRCERPQAGRKRQFHQLGVELAGPPNPVEDAEAMALQMDLLREWGLEGCRLRVNSIGLPEDRRRMTDGLREALQPHLHRLDEDARRAVDTNVLRVLDSKREETRAVVEDLPALSSFYSDEACRYFDDVCATLDLLEVPYEICPRLVRGLDYYVHTIWEITHEALGAQDALSGGGRYEITLQEKGIEGVGFAMGLERVLAAIEETSPLAEAAAQAAGMDVWVVSLGEAAFRENLILTQSLRHKGYTCGMETTPRSMKAQMRAANRAGARYVVIRGEDEYEKGTFLLKDMAEGGQAELEMPELMQRLQALRTVS